MLPTFAIKYIIRRAPDFFDWGSGVFELSELSADIISRKTFTNNFYERNNSCIEHNNMMGNYKETERVMPTTESQKNTTTQKDASSFYQLDASESWIKRGNVLLGVKRYEEAIQRYGLAIMLNPNSSKAWNFRGIALLQLGRYEESIASFNKALKINPDYQEAKTNRDIALKELN
jgi:tetratricopeptide (TPR) repeat protein